MSNEEKEPIEKIISLDNPKSVELDKNKFLLDGSYLENATALITARVNEIKDYKRLNSDGEREYIDLRMHDMIMIAGRRGSGKTTFLINLRKKLRDDKKIKDDVKVLDIIDPTLLHGNSDILLLILAGVYTKLSNDFKKRDNRTNKKNEFNTIKENLQNLHRTINLAYKFKEDENLEEDNYERLYGLHKGLEIDKDLHKFFKLVCDYYGVKALVLPIDDIDMDFKYGYKVFDTIRKYLATPCVIPIASMDLHQAHAVIKKEQYSYFGYEASTSKYDIKEESELQFLKKLPEEFLTKISLPTRRVYLPDMLSIFEKYMNNKNDYKRQITKIKDTIKDEIKLNEEILRINSSFKKIYFTFQNTEGLEFKLEFEDIVQKYINIVYGFEIQGFDEMDKNSISEYLGNKSVRSFFEDIRAFLNCITKNSFDKTSLIERYLPYSSVKFKTKYDAALGLWRKYIELTKKQLKNYNINSSNYTPSISNVKQSFYINGEDHDHTIKTKTYMRLQLQEFFINKINVKLEYINENIVNKFSITKDINIGGAMELCFRTFIPQYIFENLINREKLSKKEINLNMINLDRFESYATDDLQEIAQKLSLMQFQLNKLDKDNSIIIGGYKINHEESRVIDFETATYVEEQSESNWMFYLSSFKIISQLIELIKSINNKDTKSLNNIAKNYAKYSTNIKKINSIEYHTPNEVKKRKEKLNMIYKLFENEEFEFNTNMVELSKFSKNFINNIFAIIEHEQAYLFKLMIDKNKIKSQKCKIEKLLLSRNDIHTTMDKYKGVVTQTTMFLHHFFNMIIKNKTKYGEDVEFILPSTNIRYGVLNIYSDIKLNKDKNLLYRNFKTIYEHQDKVESLVVFAKLFDTSLYTIIGSLLNNTFMFDELNMKDNTLYSSEEYNEKEIYYPINIDFNKFDYDSLIYHVLEECNKNKDLNFTKEKVRQLISIYYFTNYNDIENKIEKDSIIEWCKYYEKSECS